MSARKTKGWVYRYEIQERETTVETKWGPHSFIAFHIIKFMGRKCGPSHFGYFRPYKEITDADLIRRSGIGNVTVPIVVVRLNSADQPVMKSAQREGENP